MYPGWFLEEFGITLPAEGCALHWNGHRFVLRRGVLRDVEVAEEKQEQTSSAFSFKWARKDTYSSSAVEAITRTWLVQRYGDWSKASFWERYGKHPLVLDAGCGAGLTARLLIGPALDIIKYVGVDISGAVDVAVESFAERHLVGAFVQADLTTLPFPERSFDVILSEGVLHHTPSTRAAIHAISRHLKPGGLFAFYVYNRKSPLREYSDDYIREQIAGLSAEEAWSAMMPLTKLGKALGDLNISVDVPEDVPLLGIPKGRIDLQRLIYWHVCKMFYRPDYSLEEMNHVNFDWFVPAYSHRQTPEEVRTWCQEAGLIVQDMRVEEAGITVHATRNN